MDEDGYFYIVDRKKDLVIRGGFNVYSREIEEVIYEHPAVREVAVIGVPHETLGEAVAAAIALKAGAEATPPSSASSSSSGSLPTSTRATCGSSTSSAAACFCAPATSTRDAAASPGCGWRRCV